MREITVDEVQDVSGAISADTGYSVAVGAAGGFLAMGLTVSAPVWGTALLLGASIAASGMAMSYATSGG